MVAWNGDVHQFDTGFFDPFTAASPVRPNVPYTPIYNVDPTGKSHVSLIGVVGLAGVVLLFEHLRRRRGR